ncbi:MAG: translocation/assembly module TamB domain-containing protein, partial [Chlamydiota bacterium]
TYLTTFDPKRVEIDPKATVHRPSGKKTPFKRDDLHAVLEQADVLHFGKKKPLQAKGSLQAHLNHHTLQVHTDLRASDSQYLELSSTLPVTHTPYPFQISLEMEKPTSAELIAEGNLEDLFDFVNLGFNYLGGNLSSRLFLSRTLEKPSLQGHLDWENGTYENYFTGVVIKGIHAHLEADGDELQLKDLFAHDEKKGRLSAEGKIHLSPKEHFPYGFNAELKSLHALGFNMIDCNLTGPLYFSGDLQQALAQGNLIVDEAKIQLTEELPLEIPTLPVTYIHRPPHLLSQSLAPTPEFQFHIDLDLTADNKVYVEGSGLNAELQGNVHLTGTNTNIDANGSLRLIKGEYQFSGKVFKLTEGEIIFTDKPTPNAYLHLNGTLSLPNVSITAMLRGPLNRPQLTFQSNPQMSTGSILALILFNKDISDISHPEAIQLASTLMSMSGGAGPDVLETIRKSIGVDRLNIVSAGDGSDEIAVQIGKYLTRGVMITLSQSATSSQVMVEVELPKGFVFQAETQEEQEGKFSLKWTRSY